MLSVPLLPENVPEKGKKATRTLLSARFDTGCTQPHAMALRLEDGENVQANCVLLDYEILFVRNTKFVLY